MVTIPFTCKPNRFSVALRPQGESINAEYMIQYLKDTGKKFHNLKKDKISLEEMHFQMDNARPHTAAATQHFMASRNVKLVKQSPYSPDLNLLDRFLFRQVKSDLRGKIVAAQLTLKRLYSAVFDLSPKIAC